MFLFFSLGPLVNKVKEFQVETIVDTLCSNMISDKEQLRDISSIGKLSLAFHLLCISIPISSIYWDVKYYYLPVVIPSTNISWPTLIYLYLSKLIEDFYDIL